MNTTITGPASQAPRTPIKAMSTTYTYTPAAATAAGPRRGAVSWRHRLARWFRLRRKQQAALPASAQGPPRLGLGPIGDDLRFRSGTGSGSLVGDLSSLKFDDRGSLQDFKLSFDASTDLPRLTGGGLSGARGVGAAGGSVGKRPPQSAKSVGAKADVPSIDLPTTQDGGFLDTWLKQADRERKEKEREAKERERRAAEKARKEADEALARRKAAEARAAAEAAKQDDGGRSKRWSTASDPRASWANGPVAKRARGSDAVEPPPLAPPKVRADAAARAAAAPTVTNAVIMAAVTSNPSYAAQQQQRPASWRNSTDASAIVPTATVGARSGSGTGSVATATSARRLSGTSTLSTASRATGADTPGATAAARSRFEVRTDALLKPVSSTSAAATAREVSATISRINSGHMATPSLSRTPSEAAASAAAAGARRSVTDSVKALHKPDGSREPSRRFSQPAIRNSYHAEAASVDFSTGAPVVVDAAPSRSRSRTPTPTDVGAGARPRRPSSQLSDRLGNRMSWLRELEENGGRAATGRDYVFGKLQGGVAAKLAALENKGSASASAPPPPIELPRGVLPRSESRASNVSASEAYGIEAAPVVRSAADKQPGSIADVVDDGFKRRLEGSLKAAQEQQEKAALAKPDLAGASSPAAAAGSHVARMAAARRRVPKDVLELIALSGVDEEVAINEYLQHGNLGRTKTWDHEEVMRQVAEAAGPVKKVEETPAAEAKAAPTEEKGEQPAAEAKAASPAEDKDEQPAVAVAVEEPVAEAAPLTEEAVKVEQPAPAPEQAAQPVTVVPGLAPEQVADGEEVKATAIPATE